MLTDEQLQAIRERLEMTTVPHWGEHAWSDVYTHAPADLRALLSDRDAMQAEIARLKAGIRNALKWCKPGLVCHNFGHKCTEAEHLYLLDALRGSEESSGG